MLYPAMTDEIRWIESIVSRDIKERAMILLISIRVYICIYEWFELVVEICGNIWAIYSLQDGIIFV
jgi:hypothetical protein